VRDGGRGYISTKIYLIPTKVHDGRCTFEIKSRISVEKAVFNKKRALFTGKMDFELRKKLVKCCTWSKTEA
jgi:hypothetical protein